MSLNVKRELSHYFIFKKLQGQKVFYQNLYRMLKTDRIYRYRASYLESQYIDKKGCLHISNFGLVFENYLCMGHVILGTYLKVVNKSMFPWWELPEYGNENSIFIEEIQNDHIKDLKHRDEVIEELNWLKKFHKK